MLQELLYALCGFTGDIFTENEHGSIKMVDKMPFISVTEQSLMNELCLLGSLYRKMNNFVQTYCCPIINKEVTGLYKLTFAYSINTNLKEYRKEICDIEKEILMDTFLSVSYIRGRLNDYFILFPSLWSVIQKVEDDNKQGCQIVDVIIRCASPMGNQVIKSIWNKIVKSCYDIMLNQITEWLLRGILSDPYAEFFIGLQVDDKSGFGVVVEKLPTCIPMMLANKILYIGESVHSFSRNNDEFVTLADKFTRPLNDLRLKENEFNLLKLQAIVEEVDREVRQKMWHLVVKENEFMKNCFNHLSDFMLLGRGEIMQALIIELEMGSNTLLSKSDNDNVSYGLHNAWRRALRTVLSEDEMDKISSKHKLILTQHGWTGLSLSVTIDWPHYLIVTPDSTLVYESLFSLLLRVRRTQTRISRLHHVRNNEDQISNGWLLLQHQMSFVIGCIHSYLSLDVVESLCTKFKQEVMSVEDIEHLQNAHATLVADLRCQTFLSSRQVRDNLMNLCDTCVDLCNTIEVATHSAPTTLQRLVQLRQKFVSQSTLLYNVLSNVDSSLSSSASGSPHLRQLLVRLDFNGYFSQKGSEFGSLLRDKNEKPIPTYQI